MRTVSIAAAGVALLFFNSLSFAERSPLEAATVKTATDCVAAVTLKHPKVTVLYQQNRLKEITDWIVLKSSECENPLAAMRILHDRLYGAGTGRAFLLGDYLADLPRAVRERVSGEVEKRSASDNDASVGQSNKDNIDGNTILYACSSNDTKNGSFCYVYMTAVSDTLAFMRDMAPDRFPICAQGGITSKQLADVLVKYIRDNPKDRHLNAATVAALAWRDAWPCNYKEDAGAQQGWNDKPPTSFRKR